MGSAEFSEDFIDLVKEYVESGYMTDFVRPSGHMIKDILLSRRIPVRE